MAEHGSSGNGASKPPSPADPLAANVRDALAKRAERIPLRALEKRGFRNVQVLDMATIEKTVVEAVTHMIERHTALSLEEKLRLGTEAKNEFSKLLAQHKQAVADKTEAERAREALERQVQGLREERDRQWRELGSERAQLDEHTFTLSPESFHEMEAKIREIFRQLVSDERRLSLAEAGPRAVRGLSELEKQVASFLDRLLVGERDRFIGSVRKQHDEKLEILEKRISKLNKALSDTEDALRRMAEAKAGDPGIASIFSTIQGLDPSEAHYSRKKELLEVIFLENLKIQKKDGAASSSTAVAPAPDPLVTAASLGFEAPLDPVTDETAF